MKLLVLALLTAEPVLSDVACQSVAQCWLSADGRATARPKAKKGRPLPRGDCGKNLLWLQHRLTCDADAGVCASQFIGDKC